MIESFLLELSQLDSNNFLDNCGVGEREGRVYSKLVQRRNFLVCTTELDGAATFPLDQPKAIGSSIIAKLANILVADAMKISGLQSIDSTTTLLLPLCTGMSLCSVFNALQHLTRRTKCKRSRTTKHDSLDAIRPEDVHKKYTSERLRCLRA